MPHTHSQHKKHQLPTCSFFFYFVFFNDTATTEIYTLSLHDALPICLRQAMSRHAATRCAEARDKRGWRSEEHTSELQSPSKLVCRLLLEKKKKTNEGRSHVEARGAGVWQQRDVLAQ